jgi:beta-lactamase regulating signal transducer with metallopeptidase domain
MNFQTFDQMLNAGFELTWRTSLQATVLVGLVLLIQVLFKRMLTPRWCYLFGLLVLLRLVMPVVPASPFSIFNLGNHISSAHPNLPDPVPVALPHPLPEVPSLDAPAAISVSFFAKYLWLGGCIGLLVVVARQQRRIARHIRRQPPVTDPKVLALLENCRTLLGIKQRIRVATTDTLKSPALFGIWRPCLIVPAEMLRSLDRRELRLVFLHELIHLKNGDIAANWFMIIVRSLHWFNPGVWLVCNRLRADQEMACDAAVMSLLAADERRFYGNTLISIAEAVSTGKLCPALAPFITNNHIIRRRIIMISKFKPASRLAVIGSAALFIVLGSVTFTDARNGLSLITQAKTQKQKNEIPDDGIQAFQRELQSQDEKVKLKEEELNRLRVHLGTPPIIPENRNPFGTDLGAMHYNSLKIEAETQWVKEQKLLSELQMLRTNSDSLRQAIPTAAPDPMLANLLQNYNEAKTRLIMLQSDFGANHPDVQRTRKLIIELNSQIDDRVAGILEGMRTRVASLKAVVENSELKVNELKEIQETAANKLNIPEAWWPYFKAKAELDQVKKFRDVLFLRLAQEKINAESRTPGH